MRDIKFRAYGPNCKMMWNWDAIKRIANTAGWEHFDAGERVLMQYTGLKDKNGVEIYEGDLLNVFFTSSDGEFIHDCIYKVEIGVLGDIQFKFVSLLWVDGGHNQYPSSATLCASYDSLGYEYENDKVKLKVPDSWGENHLHETRWKQNDKSFYFKVIGNIYENPELLNAQTKK